MPVYTLGDARPDCPEDQCWIARNAMVIGRVRLGQDASVWFGAVLRGDYELIDIGERSNVQDGCVLHTDPGFPLNIGRAARYRAVLHGCTIGPNSMVGMGAIVLNGAVIGRNCIIGANALVTEGKVIPDNSLVVGSPAKVDRELGDDAALNLRRSADTYVNNWKRYAGDLEVDLRGRSATEKAA